MGVGGSIDAGRGNTDDADVEELDDMLEQVLGRESKRDTGRGIEQQARIRCLCVLRMCACMCICICVCVHVGTHAQPPNMKQRKRSRSRR